MFIMKRKIKTKKYFVVRIPLQTRDLKLKGSDIKSLYSVDGKIVLETDKDVLVLSDTSFLYMSDSQKEIDVIYDL